MLENEIRLSIILWGLYSSCSSWSGISAIANYISRAYTNTENCVDDRQRNLHSNVQIAVVDSPLHTQPEKSVV